MTGRAAAMAAAAISFASAAAAADPAPTLMVSPGAIDLGAIERVAGNATATLHISNTSSGSLRVLAAALLDGGTGAAGDWTVTAGGACSGAIPPACVLDGGEATDLDLAFAPLALGVRDATLLLTYHDTADRSLSVPLHAIGSGPTLELPGRPATLDFGALPPGSTGTITLHIANHGTSNLADGAVAVSPAGAPFSVAPAAALTVATGASAPIAITCAPPAAGMFSATLQLSAPDVPGPPLAIPLRCTGDPEQTLVAAPPAVLLGEVRLGSSAMSPILITSPGAPLALTAAALETAIAGLGVHGAPATTPATLELTAAPTAEAALDDRLTVTAASGPPLAVAITGNAVTAAYSAPAALSLGTFCVQQPTAPRVVALTSIGSATIGVQAPALASPSSAFDLALIAPLDYPNIVAPHDRALISVTPAPQATAGVVSDDVVWTTDVAATPSMHTQLTATFVDDGGAIAPDALAFGQAVVHVDAGNDRQVTLQNCSSAALQLATPQVPAPFAIDSPSFPTSLAAGATAMFSVGFHPTKPGLVFKTLSISSPQLRDPLTVALSGEGIQPSGDGEAAPTAAGPDTTSFYACSCAGSDPGAALAVAVAALSTLRPRRRRRRPGP